MDLAKTLAFSAVGGMVAGIVGCGGDGKSAKEPGTDSSAEPAGSSATTSDAKTCCKTLNECKGKGGCKVEGGNECAGKNECKGKGGCSKREC